VPKLSVRTWIGNAYAALFGRHGDVTQQAADAACSRQTVYDHARKVEQAVAQAQRPAPSPEQLLEENRQLRQENRQLWDWLEQTIDCPEDKLRQFTVHANALGLSLTQTLGLLALLLPASRLPSRATLGRWVNQGARRARRILAILDGVCRPLVLCLCLDEIFFRRRPVLMGVEPHSLAWVLGARADDRSGDTWAQALAAWPDVQDIAADGGSGIERGLELADAARRQAAEQAGGQAQPLRVRLDTFHIRRDGARALRVEWGRAEALWEEAEKVERAKGRFDRTGTDGRTFPKGAVAKAWVPAVAAFEEACRKERAWARAVAALGVFRPDGRLNDRAWAEGELAAAAAELTGRHWAKVRRQLGDERTLTFVDRLAEELASAEPCPERRAALVALWPWRRAAPGRSVSEEGEVGAVVRETLADLLRARLGPGWKESYARVRRVLSRVVRASSAVECVNSVVRMHQARHRNLSQELLDLKRLYWNCRAFREGKRRKRCPYELLGLKLPTYDPWALLQIDPEQLEQQLFRLNPELLKQQLSSPGVAA
jgi:hypothetical protein